MGQVVDVYTGEGSTTATALVRLNVVDQAVALVMAEDLRSKVRPSVKDVFVGFGGDCSVSDEAFIVLSSLQQQLGRTRLVLFGLQDSLRFKATELKMFAYSDEHEAQRALALVL